MKIDIGAILTQSEGGARTRGLRRNISDLSRAVCVASISRSCSRAMRFYPLVPPSWSASERTSAAYFHDHRASPCFRPSAATGARDRAALRAASIHDPFIPPPSLAYTAATPWPTRHRWSAQTPTALGASLHGPGQSCDTPGTGPAAGARRLRPSMPWRCAVSSPPSAASRQA